MRITELLQKEHIKIPLTGETKREVVEELVGCFGNSDIPGNREEVIRAILDRETIMSTAIGNGIAIPHAKTPYVKSMILALGISPDGIGFEALDGKPVYLIFLLVSPDGPAGLHLRCLGALSRFLSRENCRERLRKCETSDEVLNFISTEEGEATA